MSSSAKTSSIYQTAQSFPPSAPISAVESIGTSVTSRIDYNLRFSKQAVLVVGNDTEQYSQLASQFLVSLSNVNSLDTQDSQVNVAFVSASAKLNDIQIRCRLIEQLFVNTLFDPEQSLAVSVLRFTKQQGDSISIVIDHAHALSLQVKYELCQLVSLAKKNKLTINVVLFGLIEAGQQLAINKSLFKNKVAVIDASNGQIISLDDDKMIVEKSISPLLLWQKVSLVTVMVLIAAALIWVYLIIADDVNQQAFNTKDITVFSDNKTLVTKASLSNVSMDETAIQLQKQNKVESKENAINANDMVIISQATSEDINQLLTTVNSEEYIEKIPAEVSDVLQALGVLIKQVDKNVSIIAEENYSESQPHGVGNNYYQTQAKAYKNGYVVQISVISDASLLNKFLKTHAEEIFYTYQRQIKGNESNVITSKVFQNKAQAIAAIELLPEQLVELKPWVKSISSVINEMDTLRR